MLWIGSQSLFVYNDCRFWWLSNECKMLNNRKNHVNSCALFRWNKFWIHVKNFFLITYFKLGICSKNFKIFFYPPLPSCRSVAQSLKKKGVDDPGGTVPLLKNLCILYCTQKLVFDWLHHPNCFRLRATAISLYV